MADKAKANPTRAIMSAPSQLKSNPAAIKHDRKVHTFLTQADYHRLVARIGRKPLSHVLRGLVRDFLKGDHGE